MLLAAAAVRVGEEKIVPIAALDDVLARAAVAEDGVGELAWGSSQAVAGLGDAEVAARLGATHVMRGGLRRIGDRVRLRVDLVEGATGLQVWSERFETAADAVFAVQDEVVGRIATAMVTRLQDATVRAALRRPAASLAEGRRASLPR